MKIRKDDKVVVLSGRDKGTQGKVLSVDPKAGKLIVELVSSGKLPKRLPLGSDAVRIIRDELKSRLAEVEETESYSVTTDY